MTRYACNQQPGMSWQIRISPTDDDGNFHIWAIERAGIPSQAIPFQNYRFKKAVSGFSSGLFRL